MKKTEKENQRNITAEFELTSLITLESKLNMLPKELVNIVKENQHKFNFDIRVENHFDKVAKGINIIMAVDISDEKDTAILASCTIAIAFTIRNIDNILGDIEKSFLKKQSEFLAVLNGISYSTLRGIVYSELKGSYLQNAILPVVDPSNLIQSKTQTKVVLEQ